MIHLPATRSNIGNFEMSGGGDKDAVPLDRDTSYIRVSVYSFLRQGVAESLARAEY